MVPGKVPSPLEGFFPGGNLKAAAAQGVENYSSSLGGS